MAQLDISTTALSGFGVIRRTGFAPIIWGLVQSVLAFLPVLLILPTMLEFFSVIASSGPDFDPQNAEVMRLSNQINVVQPISWICQLAAHGLVTGAIFRAVLHPDDKRWFYMRLGMGELMLVAVSIVYTLLCVVALFAAAIVIGILAFAVGGLGQNEGAGVTVAVVLGLVAVGALIWASLRFSLGFAMSHDKKQFLLFESWKLTSGHAGGLFGAGLLSVIVGWLISMVLVLVLVAIGAAIFFGSGGVAFVQSLENVQDFNDFTSRVFTPERTPLLIALGGLYVIAVAVIQGYVGTIFTAPWAEAYRQLAGPNEEVF